MALAEAVNIAPTAVPHTDHQQQELHNLSTGKDHPNDPHDPVFRSAPAAQSYDRLTAEGLDLICYGEDSRRAVPVPTRRGLDSSPALFLWESRTTNVDVMSVSNTTRPIVVSSSRNSERRRIQVALPYGVGSEATGGVAGNGGGPRGGGASGRRTGAGVGAGMMMGMLLDPPNATALEARLNEARRIKRGRDLRKERHIFLSRLTQERKERVLLEAWAASRIQALFRGFLVRPGPPLPRPRQKWTPAESNRRLVADLQAILASAGLPTIPGLGPDGRRASDSTAWGQGRRGSRSGGGGAAGGVGGGGGGGGGGGRGLRRSRSRKQRAFEDEMGTRITKVVRGFLERRRFGKRWAVWDRKRRWSGVSRIQGFWRAYRKRMGWRELESEVMDRAAAIIQARWRGMSCRMGLTRRADDDALAQRKTVSAVTIQTAARRRAAIARYGSKLTLGAARRKREARAAAEAARPRRRWNRGGGGGAAAAGGIAAGATAATEGGEANSHMRPAASAKGDGAGGTEDQAAVFRAPTVAGSGSDRDQEPPATAATSSPKNTGARNRGAAARSVASASKMGLEQQQQRCRELAHGWEHGPSNQRAQTPSNGVELDSCIGGRSTSTTTDSAKTSGLLAREPGGSTSDGSGCGGGGSGGGSGGGVCYDGEVSGGFSSRKNKRASQEANLQFVRDIIQAAVVNARKHSVDKRDDRNPPAVVVVSAGEVLPFDVAPAASNADGGSSATGLRSTPATPNEKFRSTESRQGQG